jgi:hypothetical protein
MHTKTCGTLNSVALFTAISIKVVHEQSGKVEYERERLLGIAMKQQQQQFIFSLDWHK